jgi:transposase
MENSTKLFELALQLEPPWFIEDVRFTPKSKKHTGKLDIYLNFKKGSKFKDADDAFCSVHDTVSKTWQHLDFFQHTCLLHARVPRIKASSGKVQLVEVPWARKNSGFTLLFEAFAMLLIENEMPVNKASQILRVYAKRLWTVFNYWVSHAFCKDDPSSITCMGIDETSARKGHDYVMVAADLKKRRVVFATEGKDETTIERLHKYFKTKGINPEQVTHASIDMSPSFVSGLSKYFPDTAIVFDRFHLKKMLNEALDDVRKSERRNHDQLKGNKYVFLKNQKNLTDRQRMIKFELIDAFPVLGEAVRLVELFDDFYTFDDKEQSAAFLSWWCDLVEESGISSFKKFVKTIHTHWQGIINYTEAKISNGILEGINSKIQLAKRRARGFRHVTNFIHMIYFIAGDLKFDYPLDST